MKRLFLVAFFSLLMSVSSEAKGPEYYVFFDARSAALVESALPIIATAAAAFKNTPDARIQVIGHDDTARPATESQALSVKKAEAVANALAAAGVPPKSIFVLGVGQKEQLVPIPPDTGEPQDRNVTIDRLPRDAQPRPEARPLK